MSPRNPPPPARRRALSGLTVLLTATALSAGCGGGLTGVWASSAGPGSLEFRRDGTVDVTVYGGTFAGTYEVVGKRVIVVGPNGSQVYTRCGDLLDGGHGAILVKARRRGRVGTRTKSDSPTNPHHRPFQGRTMQTPSPLSALALALLPLAGCGGGSSTPGAGTAEAALAAELVAGAAGKIRLASFRATETKEGEWLGVPMMSIGYEAEIEFLADGYWVLGGDRAGFEVSSSETWPSEGVTRGAKRQITGGVEFCKTDEGWEPRDVEIDLPRPGERSQAASAAEAPAPSPLELEARAFLQSRIEEHWVQGPDGWTTQYQLRNYAGQVMPDLPDTLHRQLRTITFTLRPEPVSESQKLNGTDYRAGVQFEATSERKYHRVKSFDDVKGWSLWSEARISPIAVERRNGEWLTSRSELFDHRKPNPDDVQPGT